MKKHPVSLLIVTTCIFCAFLLGFFLGRNRNHETVFLSSLPAEPRHNVISETAAAAPGNTEPEISFPVDLNSAGLEELTALPGIGRTLAQRILDYRTVNGPYEAPEELMNVEGIGTGKLEAILDKITTGG